MGMQLLKHESSELMAALLEVGHAGKTAFIPEPVVHCFALNLSLTLNYGTRRVVPSDLCSDSSLTHSQSRLNENIPELAYIPRSESSRRSNRKTSLSGLELC